MTRMKGNKLFNIAILEQGGPFVTEFLKTKRYRFLKTKRKQEIY